MHNQTDDQQHLAAALQSSEARYAVLRAAAQRHVRDAQILDQIRTLLARELDLATLFRTVVEKTATIFGYTHVSVYLVEASSLRMQYQVGYDSTIRSISLNTGVMGRVARTGTAAHLEDAHADPDFFGAVLNIISEICVPLVDQEAVVGVFNVESTRDVVLSETDFRLVLAISEHLNIAISRARLYTAVRESEERYRSLVELSPDAIAVHSDGVIVYINQAGVLLSGGTTSGDIIGRSVLSFVSPQYHSIVTQRIRRMQEQKLAAELMEEQFIRFDGTRVDVEVVGIPTTYAGKPATQLIVRDITERKQAEHQRSLMERRLLESQKMESLGVLAGGIAHDFNNLLLAILGNASLALLDVPANTPAHESLRHIEQITQRATDLTQQMLAYSGKGHFVVQQVDINTIITDLQPVLFHTLAATTTLQLQLAADLPPINADVAQFRQVITNLVTNAAEAINDAQGTIIIRTQLQRLDAPLSTQTTFVAGGDYVTLEVIDSGTGIDQATLPRIFDPFFSTKFTGRGLGLAVVLGIVRGHKGGINVESQPQHGTRFTIFLPPKQEIPQTPIIQNVAKSASQRNGAILVVDDEAMIRSVTERVLKRLGYTVLMAADGVEGLQTFRDHSEEIDCVLLDLTMPRMNGEELFHAIHALKPEAHVILMSGYTEEDATGHIGVHGLAGFLQKPFTINELRDKISTILTPTT